MTGGPPRRVCDWCAGDLSPRARRDAIYCGVRCRQAAHRVVIRRAELEATARPLRLAYADPPYIGLSSRYYRHEPTFAGEVDHAALVSRLAMYDGWALACSAASVTAIAALLVAADVESRLAIWTRRRPPHPTARIVSGYEGVFYSPARRVVSGSRARITDVLAGVDAPSRPTLPTAVMGMKPPAYIAWIFDLIGAMPGDELDDLYPGSGLVGRAWAQWSAPATRDASRPPAGDASPRAADDA